MKNKVKVDMLRKKLDKDTPTTVGIVMNLTGKIGFLAANSALMKAYSSKTVPMTISLKVRESKGISFPPRLDPNKNKSKKLTKVNEPSQSILCNFPQTSSFEPYPIEFFGRCKSR
ncbi:hypothetical protein WICPIJ_009614 [Wickerhamomyces pijperi]|uniref:Uncharacterized protein n=1 Tax=Wickerhamomyces pijperi TaxID=599730 RepID=A0A9P8TDG7_WICPI|nr:hypothetical protein WICPIJ_009614 [Wickerhamomyces pijperi]